MHLLHNARRVAWLGALVVASGLTPGCSCDGCSSETIDAGDSSSAGSGQGGGGGDAGSSSGTGTSSAGPGGGGQGGAGGAGGGSAAAGAPVTETVTAGEVARSARYRMVFTLGQPTQNQETTRSPRYRMQGGLIGANESLP
jgi:hypothetical protein